jgi:hypothetical protein
MIALAALEVESWIQYWGSSQSPVPSPPSPLDGRRSRRNRPATALTPYAPRPNANARPGHHFIFLNILEKGRLRGAAGWGYWKGLTQTRSTQGHRRTGSQRGAYVWRLGASGNFHDRRCFSSFFDNFFFLDTPETHTPRYDFFGQFLRFAPTGTGRRSADAPAPANAACQLQSRSSR